VQQAGSWANIATSQELNHEHDGRRDRDLDLCTQPGADLDAIRAAFLRTI
jgi:hypothetical protein